MAYQPLQNPLPVVDQSLQKIIDMLQMVCNRLDAINITLAQIATLDAQSQVPANNGDFYIDPDAVASSITQVQ